MLTLAVAVTAGSFVACDVGPHIPLDRPDGWLTDEQGSWWLPGVDTSRAFRNLESFESMGLALDSPVYSADHLAESQMAVGRHRVLEEVREDLLPLYRNRPETVDSLFWLYVADDILPAPRSGDVRALIVEYRREAYRSLMRHFRPPAARVRLGVDIPVPIPDSLRQTAAGRAVSFQIYVGADGLPKGVRQEQGVHPVLDRIALRAVTQVEWQPAYILTRGRSRPADGWVRFAVRFPGEPQNGSVD